MPWYTTLLQRSAWPSGPRRVVSRLDVIRNQAANQLVLLLSVNVSMGAVLAHISYFELISRWHTNVTLPLGSFVELP